MTAPPGAVGPLAWVLVAMACALDRLIGDPLSWPHPVQVMGWWINRLRRLGEPWCGDRPWRLRLLGGGITALVVAGSGAAGWGIEQLALGPAGPLGLPVETIWLGLPLLATGLASALAGRSLEQAVEAVLEALPSDAGRGADPGGLAEARRRLSWIVGRDVAHLDRSGILRAAAETAAENAVDGLFGPLFWMLVGASGWSALGLASGVPGPLALAWVHKAASTLDSMLGYRRGRLLWLGTAGARLDDLLTWLPARMVALTLPLAAGQLRCLESAREALRLGRPDPSPNAGVSQAAYALAARVRLGGVNVYGGVSRAKPLLGERFAAADEQAVGRILALSRRLEGLWLMMTLLLMAAISR